jgi:predicted dehydrogenase
MNGNMPIRVYAEGVTKKCASIGTEDAVIATLKFPDGAIGSFDLSWVLPDTTLAPQDYSFHLVGTEGGAYVDDFNHGLQVCTREGFKHPDLTNWPVLPLGLKGNLALSIDHFIKSVIEGREPMVSGKEAIKSLKVVMAIRESMVKYIPVKLCPGEGNTIYPENSR